jgi:ABC-type Mn2+/Zn2+ transport system permease subunit
MFDFLQYGFMQRAFIAGLCSAILLGWLGAFLTTRKMSFLGDGIAHASLAGIAFAILIGWAPMPVAIVFSIIVAIGIYVVEKKIHLSSDTAIGILFTTSMAIGIVLLQYYEGYQPELVSYLFGNILAIGKIDVLTIVISTLFILLFLYKHYTKMVFTTFDRDGAYLSGISLAYYDLSLYIISAITIVISIKLVGIILVSALIVMPSAIAKFFAKSFKSFVIYSSIFSACIVFFGLILSYFLNWPSGATIILFGFLLFVFSSIFFRT